MKREVIRVWVPFGPEVYRFKGTVYDRVDDVDVRLVADMQISSLYLRKRDVYTERKAYPFLRSEDLRLDLLPRVRSLIAAKRADHPWLALSDEQLLRDSGLYLRDIETGQEGYTRAAALLLGTDETIMSISTPPLTQAGTLNWLTGTCLPHAFGRRLRARNRRRDNRHLTPSCWK